MKETDLDPPNYSQCSHVPCEFALLRTPSLRVFGSWLPGVFPRSPGPASVGTWRAWGRTPALMEVRTARASGSGGFQRTMRMRWILEKNMRSLRGLDDVQRFLPSQGFYLLWFAKVKAQLDKASMSSRERRLPGISVIFGAIHWKLLDLEFCLNRLGPGYYTVMPDGRPLVSPHGASNAYVCGGTSNAWHERS